MLGVVIAANRFCDVMRLVADGDLRDMALAGIVQALKLLLPVGSLLWSQKWSVGVQVLCLGAR